MTRRIEVFWEAASRGKILLIVEWWWQRGRLLEP